MKFTVYGVSDWPEDCGKLFLIFKEKEFETQADAVIAARSAYSENLEVVVKEVN